MRLALALGGVPLFFLIELPRGEVIVALEVWARVPGIGMFADCDEDINPDVHGRRDVPYDGTTYYGTPSSRRNRCARSVRC